MSSASQPFSREAKSSNGCAPVSFFACCWRSGSGSATATISKSSRSCIVRTWIFQPARPRPITAARIGVGGIHSDGLFLCLRLRELEFVTVHYARDVTANDIAVFSSDGNSDCYPKCVVGGMSSIVVVEFLGRCRRAEPQVMNAAHTVVPPLRRVQHPVPVCLELSAYPSWTKGFGE